MNGLCYHLLERHFVIKFRYTDQLSTSVDILRSFSYYVATYVTENSLANLEIFYILKLH